MCRRNGIDVRILVEIEVFERPQWSCGVALPDETCVVEHVAGVSVKEDEGRSAVTVCGAL